MQPQQLNIENKLLRFRKGKYLGAGHSTICENTDGFAEHYRCATALYLLSILSQSFDIFTDRRISAPGHGREIVDALDSTEKCSYSN